MNDKDARPLVIFGAQSFAQLAWHMAVHDAGRQFLAVGIDEHCVGAAPMERLGSTTHSTGVVIP
jgi:hypothetical protein